MKRLLIAALLLVSCAASAQSFRHIYPTAGLPSNLGRLALGPLAELQRARVPFNKGAGGGGGGTWTLVQFKYRDSLGAGTGGGTCTTVSTSCAVTVTTPTAGNLLVVIGLPVDATVVRTMSAPTATAQSFTHCTNCAAGDTTTGSTDIYYSLSAAGGGSTTVTCNYSAAPGAYNSCGVYEYHWSGSSIAKDSNAAASGSTTARAVSGGACAGQTLTLNGTTDVIVQIAVPSNSISAVTGTGWTDPAQFYSGSGNAGKLNTSSGTAPSWTDASGTCAVAGIAFTGS